MSVSPVTNVRFDPFMVAVARNIAAREGLSVGAWLRRLVEKEIAQREGRCAECGRPR